MRSTTTPSPTLPPPIALPAPRGTSGTRCSDGPAHQGDEVVAIDGKTDGEREDPVDAGPLGVRGAGALVGTEDAANRLGEAAWPKGNYLVFLCRSTREPS